MTNQEFLNFDTSIFYQKGYENELKYMGNLTAYVMAVVAETHDNYTYAWKNKKAVRPNVWRTWFKYDKKLRVFLNSEAVGHIVPEHTRENEFLDKYEEVCKRFLLAYDAQYVEFHGKEDEYYTANLCYTKLYKALAPKANAEKKISIEQIVDAGFVDLRLPFCYSLDARGQIRKNEYTEDMAELYERLDTTLVTTITNIEKSSPNTGDSRKIIK